LSLGLEGLRRGSSTPVCLACAWRSRSIHFAGLRLRTWRSADVDFDEHLRPQPIPTWKGSAVRPILMVLGSWVVMSVPVGLLVGSVLKRLDTKARRQAPLAKVLEPYSARRYGRSAPVRRLSA